MTPRELEETIRRKLQSSVADAELRTGLEELAEQEKAFPGFTWLYGPELYRRNRVLFRPFLLSHFATYMILPKWRVETVEWKGSRAEALDGWLKDVDQRDDCELFRRLYDWKLNTVYRRAPDKRSREICSDLVRRLRQARNAGQRQVELRKLDLWFQLDEDTACTLYEIEPGALGPFILRHLPFTWYGGEKRVLWKRLFTLADRRQDEFCWNLYRRQSPLEAWLKDCLALCDRISDAPQLVSELEKRHLEGGGLNLADAFFEIIQRRGREVFPYIIPRLRQVWGGWFGRGSYGKMADYARKMEWWDLWAALLRTCSQPREFNREVRSLLEDRKLPEETIVERLLALAGVSREWNWPGVGLAAVHQLDEAAAMQMYERFPEMLQGPYKIHVQLSLWGESYPALLERFQQKADEEMIDYFASRLCTRYGRWGNASTLLAGAEKLADYYSSMKVDEARFSRRAARVLGQVPAFSIHQYNALIRENRLARLLFERSPAVYLADPVSLSDLVEASKIHVMALAYRALGLDDPRARELAANHLPLLLGTLLRPMQRATRMLAFGALGNAARDPETARLILDRARDAWNLPDRKYPKEQLLGLIGRLLQRFPELRGPGEQPRVFRRTPCSP